MEWQQVLGFYHVDCQLFERVGKRKINLTPLGERFFSFSESLLQEYDRLIADIGEQKGLKKGRLKVAAPFTTLYHLLPEVIRKYNREFPWVELSLLDRSQKEVVELVKNGDVDIGLALENIIPTELNKRRWKKVEPVLLTPTKHPLLQEKKVSLARIAQYPLILPPKSSNLTHRSRLEELFREHNLNYFVIMESSNVELSSLYVEMGFGVSFASIVRELPIFKKRKIEFVLLDHYLTAEHICVVTRRDKKMNSFQSAFLNMLFS